MKALISALQTQLQTSLAYVRDSDIFVTEDDRLIPAAVRFPAVGIKDGPIVYEMQTNMHEQHILDVKILAYVQLRKPEASIMGDASTSKKGVLDIIDDIFTALKNNLLSGQADIAWPIGESESELLADEDTAIQMKSITMRYTRFIS
jgi:hypothetical protein